MRKEIWKDIPGYEGLYQVSNLGRVKSLNYRRSGKEHILAEHKTGNRLLYSQVHLSKNNIVKHYYIHILVWEAFNGPKPDGMVINHKDENPGNNALDNLMLCTQSANLLWGDAQERRLNSFTGKNKRKWVIQLNQNNEILHFYQSACQAERETGVARTSVRDCCAGIMKKAGGFVWKFAE